MSIILDAIRTVGRGERGRKPLTEQQAFDVMNAFLASKEQSLSEGDEHFIGDDQMAMLLMLIRVQNETKEEVAGFVKAFQSRMPTIGADIDWPCYAGKRQTEDGMSLPWHGLAAKILSLNGYKVLLHGYKDKANKRVHVEDFLAQLDIPLAQNPDQAKELLEQHNIAYLPLNHFAPIAEEMIGWRNRYGLRTPINTVVRALNPGAARLGVRGSFHPGFQQLHAEVDQVIDRKSLSVISYKGQNGESEYNPKVSQTVWLSSESGVESFYWPEAMKEDLPLPSTNIFETNILDSNTPINSQMASIVVASMAAVLFAQCKDEQQAYKQALNYWKGFV
ncbi:MAG: glycosyl transferase family protein [Vibrio sp.]